MNASAAPHASPLVYGLMLAIPLVVAFGVAGLYAIAHWIDGAGPTPSRVAREIASWMAATGILSASGLLARFDLRPPPFAVFVGLAIGLAIWFAISARGRAMAKLPLAWLILLQGFRFPLELTMHQAYLEGVMPIQMSYSGRSFDIVSGVTALIAGGLASRKLAPRWLLWSWNVMGMLLLANILIVAVASTPIFHMFGSTPDKLNTWVAFFPYVWLPAVLVPAALAFHLVIAQALLRQR